MQCSRKAPSFQSQSPVCTLPVLFRPARQPERLDGVPRLLPFCHREDLDEPLDIYPFNSTVQCVAIALATIAPPKLTRVGDPGIPE